MRRRGGIIGKTLAAAGKLSALGAIGLLAAAPIHAAGFGIFEQGTKAMGMAGAFTAQADDPSLLFHNAGGLAFIEERQVSVGTTWFRSTKAELEGANPFPGEGYTAEQKDLSQLLPHIGWLQPVNDTFKLGIGVNAPFGLTTEWEDPDAFAGRFLSTKAALRAVDINPTLGWKVSPTFGIGIGAVARVSDVELRRNVGTLNPFTQRVADVGRLVLESDFSTGYGFNAGLLHKINPSFSWGLSYRSKVKVEYEGEAEVTQISTGNPQLDAAVRAQIPFGKKLPVETEIEFPDMASLGLAFSLTPTLLLETDFNWTGWSSFDSVGIDFVGGAGNSLPDSNIPQQWEDANNYRAGLRWSVSPANQWRFGYVFDESPQPEETVSPLLPDANRNGITVGFGHDGPGLGYDVAVMYLDFEERTRAKSLEDGETFFGTYNTKAVLLGVTLNW